MKRSLFVDKGRVAARRDRLSFKYRYTLNIVARDYAGSIDGLMVPILAWSTEAQPERLAVGQQDPFRFESELLDADAADVSAWIELTEAVSVEALAQGGFNAVQLAEPRLVECAATWPSWSGSRAHGCGQSCRQDRAASSGNGQGAAALASRAHRSLAEPRWQRLQPTQGQARAAPR
ncbi:hypothetical protein ABIC35_001732 [Sphingomonas trueperi]